MKTVLVAGATGSIGRHVIGEALRAELDVRAIVRRDADAASMPSSVAPVLADLTDPESLRSAVDGVDAVIFVHGTYGSVALAEEVDYGGVRNVLRMIDHPVRIALMTAISVTDRKGAHDWKRRAERLVRASGHPYTIVRPGWFDLNKPDQHRLVALQGDRRQSGTPRDGVVARRDIARVLVDSLLVAEATRKTFELVAEGGPSPATLALLFSALEADHEGEIDGVQDARNMALASEPGYVVSDIRALQGPAVI